MTERKQIAAITTAYFPLSHADVILTKFFRGFPTDDDGWLEPRVKIASLYIDQVADNDIGRGLARENRVLLCPSIRQALTLGWTELQVDGVLLIAEHGEYPLTPEGMTRYPRRPFFEEITDIIAASGRSIPVYVDKELAYTWEDAKWMVDRAKALSLPLMAGSVLPLGWRKPFLEHPLETPLEEAVAVGYGWLNEYGIHSLEVLQCMAERRQGGETGVAAVQTLEGGAVWEAETEGRWSKALAEAADHTIEYHAEGGREANAARPLAIVIEYRDGFQGTVLLLNDYIWAWGYAARLTGGEIQGTTPFFQRELPCTNFSYLNRNLEAMFLTGEPVYPAERTLLTTGILDAAVRSWAQGGTRIETPHLDIAYRSYETPPYRPPGPFPTGAALDAEPLKAGPAAWGLAATAAG